MATVANQTKCYLTFHSYGQDALIPWSYDSPNELPPFFDEMVRSDRVHRPSPLLDVVIKADVVAVRSGRQRHPSADQRVRHPLRSVQLVRVLRSHGR